VVNAIKAREAEIEAAAARRAVLTPTRSATRRGSPQKTTFAGGRVAVVTLPLVRYLCLWGLSIEISASGW